jgi:DNA-binding transcriptional ArsR family regulator
VAEERLPPEIRRFIDRYIDSVARLEVLLVVFRSGSHLVATDVARALKIHVEHASAELEALTRAGLVRAEPDGVVLADEPRQRARIEELASLYGTYRVSITTQIFSKPGESIRSFSDAFRLRREDD